MAIWQMINIFNLPSMPLEAQKLNDEFFNVYDKLNYIRTLGLGYGKPAAPLEGELYNDGEKINIYLGPGLGPEGDGFVPVAYIDPDNRYPLKEDFNTFKDTVNTLISSVATSINIINASISSLDSRIGTIETVNIPNINNQLTAVNTTLNTHTSQIYNVSLTANSAYQIALTTSTSLTNLSATVSRLSTSVSLLSTSVSMLSTSITALKNKIIKGGYKLFGRIYFTISDVCVDFAVNIQSVSVSHLSYQTEIYITPINSLNDLSTGIFVAPIIFPSLYQVFTSINIAGHLIVAIRQINLSVSASSVIITTSSISGGGFFVVAFNNLTSPDVL